MIPINTESDERDYESADKLRDSIAARTGLIGIYLQCPREKSSSTPCIARDGQAAVAFGYWAVCAGCDASLRSLIQTEESMSAIKTSGCESPQGPPEISTPEEPMVAD